ncbi:hypothetical protein EFB08_00370 [Rufibacter latericius]|uniref:Uncharacterized protein n=1 Tax=Rufibacter latericius TaxID=2487040 RepID=A0A3M9MZP4_9BACT|nr:hypothetical protein EFB08_00370 [Rufibacter latericius]
MIVDKSDGINTYVMPTVGVKTAKKMGSMQIKGSALLFFHDLILSLKRAWMETVEAEPAAICAEKRAEVRCFGQKYYL